MRKLLIISLLFSGFLIGGCMLGAGGQPEHPDESIVRTQDEWEIYLPFDEYQLSLSENSVVFAAQERLTADCMRARGVEWEEIKPGGEKVSSGNLRRYGVLDESIAASYGYHMPPPGPAVLRRLKEEQEREKNLNSIGYLKAFGKDGFGGCARRAYEKLLEGAPVADLDLYNKLNRKSFKMAMETPAVERVMLEWGKCIRRENYRYANPIEMSGDSRWFSGGGISNKEREAALVDVKCNKKTGLATAWMSQEAKIQQDLIHANVKYFDDLKKNRQLNVKSAQKVLRIK